MASVTVELTPKTEEQLRQQASLLGQNLETYLRNLVEEALSGAAETPDMLGQGLAWLRGRKAEDVRASRERILGASAPGREIPADSTILDVLEGKWPGTETDAEIRDVLDRLS